MAQSRQQKSLVLQPIIPSKENDLYGWRKRLNSSRMIFLWVLMLMSLASPASVRAGIIDLGELLDITEKVPPRGTPTLDAAISGFNPGTSWAAHAFQDDLSGAATSDDNHGLEVLGKDSFPIIDFSNIDPTELKELEIELRFSASQK